MSLFDDVLGEAEEHHFGPQEGFAGVMLCASACDGHIGGDEAQAVNQMLGSKSLYSRLSPQQTGSMMDRLVGHLERKGHEQLLLKSYPAVPPELRECAFANAVDIVLADGVVEQEEREFIDDLQTKLEIDADRAKTIVKVMVYKNHG